MKVLFRIDDLGLSLGINRAIMQSIDFQLVKNIGIIVNLPYSKEGLEFAKHHNKLCFGLHVNLVLGRPCSEVAENSSLIHSGMGNFISSSTRRIELNSEKDLFDCDDTYNEVKAQIEKFIHTTGRKPDYIDQHAVSTPTTNKVVKCLAIEYQIPYYEDKDNPVILFHPLINELAGNDLYQMIDRRKLDLEKVNHFIFHPGYIDDYLIRSSSLTYSRLFDLNLLNSVTTKKWLVDNNIKMQTFWDIANNPC